jgi:teichuronic acid biosynthesis glycosyltransferase TuaC
LRVLVLTKRQYMAKDLIEDQFGRFWELPFELARLGHQVTGLTLSYRSRTEGEFIGRDGPDNVQLPWTSVNLMRGYFPQIERYARRALGIARQFHPDVIWSCSDAYHAIFGSWLARKVKAPHVIDLYDNFEAFNASKVPGVLPAFRRVLKAADGVTAFSARLAEHVERSYRRTKATTVIENGIRSDIFRPRDKHGARQRLGLPTDSIIIGTAGALDESRGIETLFQAYQDLTREMVDLHLAVAGPRSARLTIPRGPRVHDLANLPHENVPEFLNALDLAVICYRNSAQGEISFPQKAYEIVACRIPFVAARVGSMIEFLDNYPNCLFEPENPASLAEAIRRQLIDKAIVDIPVPSWNDSAIRLSTFFRQLLTDRQSSNMSFS